MNNCCVNLPIVSVIIPVYNIEKYIGKCLESILNQSYDNWEAIVVNDGSTDSSLKICESFAKTDSRFKVITIENGGPSNARNHGLDLVKGEFVMFVDGDDMLLPDAIKISVEQLHLLQVDIVCMSGVRITEDGEKELGVISQTPSDRLDAMSVTRMIHSGHGIIPGIWGKLYKTKSLNGIRLNLKMRIAEDIFFNTELLCRYSETTIAITNIIAYQYRIRQSSLTHTLPTTEVRPYIEAMSNLISQYSGKRDSGTLSLMANSIFSLIVNDVVRKPFFHRYPDEWCLSMINQLTFCISEQRYQKLAKVSSNQKKSIIGYTKCKYSRLILKYYHGLIKQFQKQH